VIPSTFTNYDDTRLVITVIAPPHRMLCSNNSGWDVRATEHGLTFRRKLCLALSRLWPWRKLRLVRARLWPTTSATTPRESRRRPLRQTVLTPPSTTACPEGGSTKASGEISVSPEPGLGQDNIA
jgi:hypothetical protein